MRPTIERIAQEVCNEFNIPISDLTRTEWPNKYRPRHGKTTKRCPRKVTIAKQVICYFAYKYKLIETSWQARNGLIQILNYSSHGHILHNSKLTDSVMSVDKDFLQKVKCIDDILSSQ